MNLLFQIVLICVVSFNQAAWLDPDTGLNLYELITNHGYYYENYTVITDDGYILRTVRIPRGRDEDGSNDTTKPPILIQHGLLSNPADWLTFGEDSLGFLLAENGFDVFLMASRGCTYSNEHVNLSSTNSEEYWKFSWNELGYYDIPANIDLILNVTGQETLSYVGHSQGGTSFLVMASTKPEYLAKISMAHLLGPVVYMDYTRIPFIQGAIQNEEAFEHIITDFGLTENGVLTFSPILEAFSDLFCARDSVTVELCVAFIGELFGPDQLQVNRSKITVLTSNSPAGGSFQEMFHYLQVANSSIFRKFDYRDDNINVYNQTEPPVYDLSSITDVPIYIWYSLNDNFSGVLDSLRLVGEVPSAVGKLVSYQLWNHIDFTFGKDVRTYINDELVEILLAAV